MRKSLVIVTGIILLLLSGCRQEEFSRYPSITVPAYSRGDYYRMLSDRNPEIVYNAVCNLSRDAGEIGEALSHGKAAGNSKEYSDALAAYQKISQLLLSGNDKVVSAGLRFLQLFSEKYPQKKELLEPVLKIRSASSDVQFEQLALLNMIVSPGTKIDRSVLGKSLNSRSWLVSREAYALVNALEDYTLRMDLVRKYAGTNDEMEKLLIIGALQNNFSDDILEFLGKEALSAKSAKIKDSIFGILSQAADKDRVLVWVDRNYGRFSKKDIETLLSLYGDSAGNDFAGGLVNIFIKKGLVLKEDLMRSLLNQMISAQSDTSPDTGKKRKDNLARIEKEIVSRDDLRDAWTALKNEKEIKDQRIAQINREIKDQFNESMGRFTSNARPILEKYNVDNKKIENYLKGFDKAQQDFNAAVTDFDAPVDAREPNK